MKLIVIRLALLIGTLFALNSPAQSQSSYDKIAGPTQSLPVFVLLESPSAKIKWVFLFDSRECPNDQKVFRFLSSPQRDLKEVAGSYYCGNIRMAYFGSTSHTELWRQFVDNVILDQGRPANVNLPTLAHTCKSECLGDVNLTYRSRLATKSISFSNSTKPTEADIANIYSRYSTLFDSMNHQGNMAGLTDITYPFLGKVMSVNRDITNLSCRTLKSAAVSCSYDIAVGVSTHGLLSVFGAFIPDYSNKVSVSNVFYRAGGRWESDAIKEWTRRTAADLRSAGSNASIRSSQPTYQPRSIGCDAGYHFLCPGGVP
ncbi:MULTISPECIES: hypothetical protein [unclassified Sphingobium]|uniref:hypothetical protein n=1 Tax=unclassified Sphingobium TaxID=2611147 RepID=UPI0022248795|nr:MULTISPECIES: hypothetical protein [unclassified Sphingobium]MCW2412948.1 hypothetical protein [Sphingobium sp. B8D3D]MCW2414754.1 hypothetical protein [Sphingobium sp. B8D3A]